MGVYVFIGSVMCYRVDGAVYFQSQVRSNSLIDEHAESLQLF